MTQNCYGCKYALEARNLPRYGQQVRCQKAEELFGGKRWVNVNLTGFPKCGEFEPFTGNTSVTCDLCRGTGQIGIKLVSKVEPMKCHKCSGKGVI